MHSSAVLELSWYVDLPASCACTGLCLAPAFPLAAHRLTLPARPLAHPQPVLFALIVFDVSARVMQGELSASALSAILAIAVGFAVTAALVVILSVAVDVWQPFTAESARWMTVDLVTLGAMLGVGSCCVVWYSEPAHELYARISQAVAPLAAQAAGNGLGALHAWGIPAAAIPVLVVGGSAAALFGASAAAIRRIRRVSATVASMTSHVSWRGQWSRAKFAVTINGGPGTGEQLARMLDLLHGQHVHATFFVSRVDAEEFPAALRAIASAGHELGVLGVAGPHSTETLMADIQATMTAITAATGHVARWYRPQDGARDVRVLRAANSAGLAVALWSVTPMEWDGTVGACHERVRSQAHPVGGDIAVVNLDTPEWLAPPPALQHSSVPAISAVTAILHELRDVRDQSAVTLSELCPNQGAGKEAW